MRRLLPTLFVLSLLVVACGSPDSPEPSTSDEDALIETKVAATVAAAIGEDEDSSEAVQPTEAILGNATPLTPIPQLIEESPAEESPIEVSPEVEYVEPGQDGQLTFDFGGGGTEEAPPETGSYRIGELARLPGHQTFALLEAQLVDSYEDSRGSAVLREGYKYVLLRAAIGAFEYLPGRAVYFDEVPEPILFDGDNYPYLCSFRQAPARLHSSPSGFQDPLHLVELASVFPGYERVFEYFCEVPVTVSDSVGRFRLQTGYRGISCDDCPMFDLSKVADTSAPELPVEEDHHFDLNEPINILCGKTPGNEGGFWATDIVVTFTNARWTGRDYVSEYVAGEVAVPEIGIASIDVETYNQGRVDWPSINSFTGMPLEPGRHSPRYQTNLENSTRLTPPSTVPVPPGASAKGTFEFGVDKRSETINLAFSAGTSCTYNGQPYLILRTGLPAQTQTGNAPSNDTAAGSSTNDNLLSISATEPRAITGITLNESQQVSITHVQGQWQPGPSPQWSPVGPEGDNRVPGKASFPKPDAPLMALIFGIEGFDQVYQFQGNPMSFTVPASGVLWFGPNDDGFSDNAGELVIAVSVK